MKKTRLKWVVLACALIFLLASVGMVFAQQRDQMQSRQQQPGYTSQPQMGRDTGAGDREIYDVLKNEHDQVKDLLSKIGDSRDAQNTSQLMAQLRSALVPHMKAEEKVVYSALQKDNKTKSLAIQSQKEHQAAEKILNEMANMSGDNPRFQASFNMLNQSIRTHLENEEGPLFSAAKDVLNDQQARRLAQNYIAAERQIASQQMPKVG